jgi:hypothetical protein
VFAAEIRREINTQEYREETGIGELGPVLENRRSKVIEEEMTRFHRYLK